MIHKIFTIYDEKAKAYLPPFFLPEKGQAVRCFSDCINSEDHQFGKHPHDYTLFWLGVYDDETALFENFAPQPLGNGVEFLYSPEDVEKEPTNASQISNDAPVLSGAQSGNSS